MVIALVLVITYCETCERQTEGLTGSPCLAVSCGHVVPVHTATHLVVMVEVGEGVGEVEGVPRCLPLEGVGAVALPPQQVHSAGEQGHFHLRECGGRREGGGGRGREERQRCTYVHMTSASVYVRKLVKYCMSR